MSGIMPPPIAPPAIAPGSIPGRQSGAQSRHVDAARSFETMVATELARTLFETSNGSEESSELSLWQGRLAEAVGKSMSERGTLGLADRVAGELRRMDGERK